MASWQSLGIVTPKLGQWLLFNSPSIGGETFRVTFLNLGLSPENRIWKSFAVLDSLYATDESGSSSRLYPSVEKQVIYLPIPPEFKTAGLIVRYLRIRKFPKRFLGRVEEPIWAVELEEFIL
ncbi:hypothetical protein BST81_03520 [Leptolyngbya sp. 'hensonii']|uniref:hypothetical protein n=1 Tax=Leptolyngbya sp. 'hensonii' TaxID=1922337 RepID=UPI00094F5CAC|nr:hypothetical protein [Leptolyngbya sp. 'hensonii']OLP19812.1 hypothetical protein BST81_03520 [Leptolyngbya sp. 'hensonii']